MVSKTNPYLFFGDRSLLVLRQVGGRQDDTQLLFLLNDALSQRRYILLIDLDLIEGLFQLTGSVLDVPCELFELRDDLLRHLNDLRVTADSRTEMNLFKFEK